MVPILSYVFWNNNSNKFRDDKKKNGTMNLNLTSKLQLIIALGVQYHTPLISRLQDIA